MDPTSRARAEAAVRRYAPELAAAALVELGQGLDHPVLLAGDLVLRVGNGADLAREAALLRLLAPRLLLPVPVPVFVDEDAGVLAHPLLPGRSLLGRGADPAHARLLGRFLRDLHDIDPADVAGLVPVDDADPGEWLAGLPGPPELVHVAQVTVPPPAERRVLAHADLGAEHLLVQDGSLTGVIDWSDAAVTDPATDFARLYRDFGPAFLSVLLGAYGPVAPDIARIRWFARCAALEDLDYGLRTGRADYASAARRSLTWLFPELFPGP